jgi:hypothetical protein
VTPHVNERQPRWESISYKLSGALRNNGHTAGRERAQPRCSVEHRTEVVAVAFLRFTAVQRDTHP